MPVKGILLIFLSAVVTAMFLQKDDVLRLVEHLLKKDSDSDEENKN